MKAAKILAATALTLAMASSASAAVIFTNGTTIDVAAVTDHEVDGDDMDGMRILATMIRTDNSTFTIEAFWDADFDSSGDHGGVVFRSLSGDNFDLEVEGDTFDNDAWDLDLILNGTGVRLFKLEFDGLSGNTVFDRCWPGTSQSTNCNNDNGIEGTPGSDVGKTFGNFSDFDDDDITATYLNRVSVGGNAPVGDIFANFILQFGNGTYGNALPEGGSDDDEYSFSLDTDNVRRATPPAVPEPGSMILLGSGLVGLATRLRRKKQQ